MLHRIPSVRDIDSDWTANHHLNGVAGEIKRVGTAQEIFHQTITQPIRGSAEKRDSNSAALDQLLTENDPDAVKNRKKVVECIDQVWNQSMDPSHTAPTHEIMRSSKLELYAVCLSEKLQVTRNAKGRPLIPDLKENAQRLAEVYKILHIDIRNKDTTSPAAESLCDNYPLVLDQLATVQSDLPEDYYHELPKIADGVLAGYPRVFGISLIMVAYTDSSIDSDFLTRFIGAFQHGTPLTIGELWAVAITLRIVLFKQLRMLSERVSDQQNQKNRANSIADSLLASVTLPTITSTDLIQVLSKSLSSHQELDRTLIVQLTQRLRDQDPILRSSFDWLDQQLTARYQTTTANVIQMDHHSQASDQSSMQNIITSMRVLDHINWMEFVEDASLVHRVLEHDPAEVFSRMSAQTRDHYRHAVERIAKRSMVSQIEIAQLSVDRASQFKESAKKGHVGYWLIGDGVADIESSVSYEATFRELVYRQITKYPTPFYLGLLAILTIIVMIPSVMYAHCSTSQEDWGLGSLLLYVTLTLLPCSDLAVCLVNHTITLIIPPKQFPAMCSPESGIARSARTMVVIPMLLTSQAGISHIIRNLEVHYLSNRDPNLFFAILSDFIDAPVESMPTDDLLLSSAKSQIASLNSLYQASEMDARFFVFHRTRLFNPKQSESGIWMGKERKRGKLEEFNLLLRGSKTTSFVEVQARPELLRSIQFVITLDQDTSLPRDTARRLIDIITHPLNTPVIDAKTKCVTDGYGILQPRVSVSLESALATRFNSLFSNWIGIDAYHTTVSDVYQDLFDCGSFVGKGLYVVDAFMEATANRIPDNAILSHDLFESLFVKSGLVSQIELFDDHPSEWTTFARRQHRWIRGDWQLLPFLMRRVPSATGTTPNPFSVINKWKIIDNLRRSLIAPALLIWLICSWFVLPGSPLSWTLLAAVTGFLFPVYALLSSMIIQLTGRLTWSVWLMKVLQELKIIVAQVVIGTAFLVETSANSVDGIGRTLYRLFFSRRLLLEWPNSSQFKEVKSESKFFEVGPVTALAVGSMLAVTRWGSLPSAWPFLLAWFSAPWIKLALQQCPVSEPELGPDSVASFRAYARRTWHFFETFVTADDHWLAPDNYQFDPIPVVAHRTSPTNIGLQLLSTIAAHDLGYLGTLETLELIEKIFSTMNKLERFRGHFFNWYDTQAAKPLDPKYVSTVDSGNLAGHLLIVKQWALEHATVSTERDEMNLGIADTLNQLAFEIRAVAGLSTTSDAVSISQLSEIVTLAIAMVSHPKRSTCSKLNQSQSLEELLQHLEDLLESLMLDPKGVQAFQNSKSWMNLALKQTRESQRDKMCLSSQQTLYRERLYAIVSLCETLFHEMDFKFLFDTNRKLFCIGYDVAGHHLDHYHYDLLASESRLASFIAIAKGDVAQEHWFRLGRQMTHVAGSQALISWTASMFEYLMPLLIMRSYDNTLLDQTYKAIVQRQIEYGQIHEVPWGVSEAGLNARSIQMDYQYGPFGVPGLGLKRGLSDDLVISPYSTMLAAMVNPAAALVNLKRLERLGALQQFGFIESIDYTATRLPSNQTSALLSSHMAHHQGMSLVALNNLLHTNIMQERFHHDPLVRSTQLLLQERIPYDSRLSQPRADEVKFEGSSIFSMNRSNPRMYSNPSSPNPRVQLLSNGRYSVMITTAGGGYSRCNDLAITRWREDSTRDCWGSWIYVRDTESGEHWSVCFQPSGRRPEEFQCIMNEDKVEMIRLDQEIVTHTEIIVTTTDDVELRRVSLTNRGRSIRVIELTSFMEIVLTGQQDDEAHSAFQNLFVQTDFDKNTQCLLATRRQRDAIQPQPWAFHCLAVEAGTSEAMQFETDRSRFIGRGGSATLPFALTSFNPQLSNTVGPVLDPCFSLRQVIRIPPGSTARVTFCTGVATDREGAVRLAERYQDPHIFLREETMVWTQTQVQLRHLGIDNQNARAYQRLPSCVLYSDPSVRPHARLLASNKHVQANLWHYGISGDLPIILVAVADLNNMNLVRDILNAHEYLRLKGLIVDIVILNEHPPSYVQILQEEIQRMVSASTAAPLLDKRGGIMIRRSDIMLTDDIVLLKTIARMYLRADQGSLSDQLNRRPLQVPLPPALVPIVKKAVNSDDTTLPLHTVPRQLSRHQSSGSELLHFNGLGGFSKDGREYVITLSEGQWTPAPWINVIANDNDFGCTISESGCGYTFSMNSRENRLTPWSNDPVCDMSGEVVYIRDETTGEFWNPTPLPIRGPEKYVVHHGQGYTTFSHTSHGIQQFLRVFVPLMPHDKQEGLKIMELTLHNNSSDTRHLSVTWFNEWVMGIQRAQSSRTVVTEVDPETNAVLAYNTYNNEFAERVAFAQLVSDDERSVTGDRTEFIGRNGNTAHPASMLRTRLSGSVGAGIDPCAALRTAFVLAPGTSKRLIIQLGESQCADDARKLIIKYSVPEQIDAAFKVVGDHWNKVLSTIQVKTPDASLNTLVNRWLLYQTLSCRIWARSALYQSGGAWGFRDQLQDVMAMVYSDPRITREHLIRCAGRQFPEGDVQHWWHCPSGRGVRTRCSDDALFFPFVLCFYIKVTGDVSILKEKVPFLKASLLEPNQEDSYSIPTIDHEQTVDLLDHAICVCDRQLQGGEHGLPFMGSHDWNDGMSNVGIHGRGESVWLGWFCYATLKSFAALCESEGRTDKCLAYRERLVSLQCSIETHAWEGDRYKRAWFDDGTPLGSKLNDECQIDSIAQSWAVLSGAGDRNRASKALESAEKYLIDRDAQIIKLFTPPFDTGKLNPGYIRGYLPGVRENGGMYTHAAIWLIMAFAEMGDGDRAADLFHMINPINHTSTRAGVQRYKVEPYVMAADVYGLAPHLGRGGWTFYTGSSSWYYRCAIESILGLTIKQGTLTMNPHIPRKWPAFEMTYRATNSTYNIVVLNFVGEKQIEAESPGIHQPVYELDGQILREQFVTIASDNKTHTLRIQL